MATPLTNLTKKDVKWEWTEKCREAFEQIKECLTTAPLLKMPDPSRSFEVIADASKTAVGAVLMQDHLVIITIRSAMPTGSSFQLS